VHVDAGTSPVIGRLVPSTLFRGGGEASASLLSHRRVSSDRVRAKLQRRSSRRPRYRVVLVSSIELARDLRFLLRLRHDAFVIRTVFSDRDDDNR